MRDEDLALLQKFAVKPTRYVSPSVRRQLITALEAGHVTFGPYGWITTRQGLAEIGATQGLSTGRPAEAEPLDLYSP